MAMFREWLRRLWGTLRPNPRDRELQEELQTHLEMLAEEARRRGDSPEGAARAARLQAGGIAQAMETLRDQRGLPWLDDLVRDILYAFRTFRRAPLASVTIVTTVALGLGLVAAVFAVYNMIFLRPDAVRNPGELFAVERYESRTEAQFTRLEFEAMRRETSVFADMVAMLQCCAPAGARIDGRPARGTLVTGNFFQFLGVQAALGRALTPADDERPAGRPVIVLGHRAWNKLFAADPAAIGRSVRINGLPYEIVGVMPEEFRGLSISAPDYWAPLSLAGQFRDQLADGDRITVQIVGRLKAGMSEEAADAGLTVWASASRAQALGGEEKTGPPVAIALSPRTGALPFVGIESIGPFAPLFFSFGLILLIGCANVANLLLARGVTRQREIGTRLSLGASRRRIVRQLLTENLLLALGAGALGFVVLRLFLAGALYLTTRTVPMELVEVELDRFVPATDWRIVAFLVAGAILSTALFGLAPALQATRLELVRTLRGEVTRDGRPGRARHALIAVQVGASALLLICAAIFLRGAIASATADPGVRTSDTVRVSVANETRRAALLQAVTADPSVQAVAASSLPMNAVAETSDPVRLKPDTTGTVRLKPDTTRDLTSSRVPVELLAVSPEYFDVLGIELVSGRSFTQAERAPEAGVVVVHESVARQLWPNRNAVGQVMRLDSPPSARPGTPSLPAGAFTVIGVARDPGSGNNISYLFSFRGVYLPTSSETARTWLYLRIHGDPDQARPALLERLATVDSDLSIITLRSMAGMQTYVLQFAFWLAVVLGGLALLLTVSGLFSVLSYVVEQRAKEIGVRMALGATTRDVAALVLFQSFRPVGVGLAAGGGLAAALAVALMSTSAASELGGWVDVLDPLAYVASLLIIVISCVLAVSIPAMRAARIDPIATLRMD